MSNILFAAGSLILCVMIFGIILWGLIRLAIELEETYDLPSGLGLFIVGSTLALFCFGLGALLA